MLEASPEEAFLYFAVAKEYEKLKALDKAHDYYQQLIQLDPDYVGAYYHLGKLYEQQQQPEQAIQTYEQGMQVARKVGDQHALGELAGAKLNLTDD